MQSLVPGPTQDPAADPQGQDAARLLHESQERLRLGLLAGQVGTWDWDIPANRGTWSDRLYEIHGLERGSFGGTLEDFSRLVHPEDAQRVTDVLRAALEEAEEYQVEFRTIRPDGSVRWLSTTGRVFYEENGEPQRMVGATIDITDRRLVEERLRESERRFRELAENISEVFYITDLRDQQVLYVSPAFERIWGRSRQSLYGDIGVFLEGVHPEDRARAKEAMGRQSDGLATQVQYRVLRPDGGAVRWVNDRAYPVRNDAGVVYRVAGIVEDVTEQRQARQARRLSELRFQRLVEQSPLSTQIFWPDGRMRAANSAWEQLWGVSTQDVPDYNILEDEQLQKAGISGLIRKAFEGEPVTIDPIPYTPDRGRYAGEVRWCGAFVYPVKDDEGQIIEVVLVHSDVTERMRVEDELRAAKERAEAASRAKDEFLAVLSHELRTPLTPVLLTVSVLESHPQLPPDLRGEVAVIRQNVELESRLISDLLDLTRIAKGKLDLSFKAVDVHEVIASAIDICRRPESPEIVLSLRAGRHHVSADTARLQQVFWNLINNAQKFTPEEGSITIRTRNDRRGRVLIEVQDTGTGIDPELLPRLFTAFEQGQDRLPRQFGGLGLGLAISRRLVDAHGGRIAARSDGRGRGAVFTVELPTIDSKAATRTPAADPAAPPQSTPRCLRVLIVEDHEATSRAMQKLFVRLGHQAATASTLASGRMALQTERFDLVISDLGLPDGSGLDLLQDHRQHYAGRAIALTGYGMEEDVERTRKAGFAAHVTKPVDFERLQSVIQRLLPNQPAGPASGKGL